MHAKGNNYMHVNGCDSINTVKRDSLLATPFLNETLELPSFISTINPYFSLSFMLYEDIGSAI